MALCPLDCLNRPYHVDLQGQRIRADHQTPIPGPSKMIASEFTGKFPLFRALMVSATIEVDLSNRLKFESEKRQARQVGGPQTVQQSASSPYRQIPEGARHHRNRFFDEI
jgi:hypothetical protein